MTAYGPLDKLLHRLALQLGPVAELSFDLDQRLAASGNAGIAEARHVFVSGLARAGTTVLMRRFHATGAYSSLTYRDMPFVLAPNLWRKLKAGGNQEVSKSERAHGDRILVDADSPESFDEVFWRIFAGDEYIFKTTLTPHRPDPEIVAKYVRYVAAILASRDGEGRCYLSKNNNNVLRLGAIREAFAHALILVPMREPLAQAASLQRQHSLFSALQREDPFAKAYMTWLGHHEFGLDHRPFRFDARTPPGGPPAMPESIDYWLGIWADTYEWLEREAPADVTFVVYEDLCRDPQVWERLAAVADIDPALGAEEPFQSGNPKPVDVTTGDSASSTDRPNAQLLDRAMAIYQRLAQRARAAAG